MTIKILDHDYSTQETGWYCGPGAAQIVLTILGIDVPEQQLARELGTTTNGTDWIGQISGLLARYTGREYRAVEMPHDPPTAAQRDRLWSDIVATIDAGAGLVANIWAPPGNQPPGYPARQTIMHYFAVVGYDDAARSVYIADPANFGGLQHYWLSLTKLASLIPPKGYAAAPGPARPVVDEAAIWADVALQLHGPGPVPA